MRAPDVLVPFEQIRWESPVPGCRVKSFVRGPRRLRLLEFASGFTEPDWCTHAHAVHVLDGSMTLRMRDGEVKLKKGDTLLIDAGDEHAHRAVTGPDETALLLLFERG